MIKIRKKGGFTLLELMISMAIFAMIMTSIMVVVQSMMVSRIKNMNRLNLTEQLYAFSEILFTEIKNGGTIDYEEYWNRKTFNTESYSGHYLYPTGVGNYGQNGSIPWLQPNGTSSNQNAFGAGLYLCRSKDSSNFVQTDGCVSDTLNNSNTNQIGSYQRFWEYELQFWDYNNNKNTDKWDENGDGDIVGDEDDVNLWNGPEVFSGQTLELYLIEKNEKTRTFFRWNIIEDPNKKIPCKVNEDTIHWWFKTSGDCLWNIQILKMTGHDYGLDHDGANWSNKKGAFDGKIDTWTCNDGWNCFTPTNNNNPLAQNIATGRNEEWVNIFPNSINVKNFRIELFPKKDPWLAVAAPDCPANSSTNCVSPFIHPYAKISLELGFSQGKRRTIRNENPTISYSTTISLDDFH